MVVPQIVNKGECQVWTGRVDAYGRPITTHGRTYRVQHESFKRRYGYKPNRIALSCDNPRCVNPLHLFELPLEKMMLAIEFEISRLDIELEEVANRELPKPGDVNFEASFKFQMEQAVLANKKQNLKTALDELKERMVGNDKV